MSHTTLSLAGIRVLDLTRVLAGPSCTQLLGDLGAEIIKVERPGAGDDTRQWGPPFLQRADGTRGESAYFVAANRNKRSVAIDFATPDGADLVAKLAAHCDVLVENFLPGTLARYGLDHATLAAKVPRLVYCSITGFGQTGPAAHLPGYDFAIQAMGGLMSITGSPASEPQKVGVAVADLFTGLYAAVGILAALHHRDATGHGQAIDLALFDTQLAMLANQATNAFTTGTAPERLGNAHPNIVPYEAFRTSDGTLVLAIGSDAQFATFCQIVKLPQLAHDPRYATNAARVTHRNELCGWLAEVLATRTTQAWLEALRTAGVPAAPVNDVVQAFAEPQAARRKMAVETTLTDGTHVRVPGNPLHLNATPVHYGLPPPLLGEHTRAVLREVLHLDEARLDVLEQDDVVHTHERARPNSHSAIDPAAVTGTMTSPRTPRES